MVTFPSPSQILTSFKTFLKSIKPDLNTNDGRSDFIIRGKVVSGLISGLYGDQKKVDDDTYISSSRPEALTGHGQDYGIPQLPATYAACPQATFTGTIGQPIPIGTQLRYVATGVVYQTTAPLVIGGGGNIDGAFIALTAGQIGNVEAPDTLQIISPPPGINPTVTLVQNVADGSDAESQDSYKSRLLSRAQFPPAGGNQEDYPEFAFKASNAVRTASIVRFGRGLGTVDIYITSGTTDIDSAVTNGIAVVRIPSGPTIATVQAYYEANAPLTDCPKVFAPVEVLIPVTVNVDLAAGLTLASVPVDPTYNPLGLTVQQLIQREVGRPLYKYAVGGRKLPGFGTNGWVVGSDIEDSMDFWLSAVPDSSGLVPGLIPILTDLRIQNLDGGNTNKALVGNQLAKPGVVTVVLGT